MQVVSFVTEADRASLALWLVNVPFPNPGEKQNLEAAPPYPAGGVTGLFSVIPNPTHSVVVPMGFRHTFLKHLALDQETAFNLSVGEKSRNSFAFFFADNYTSA
jgi:hypothetical protein